MTFQSKFRLLALAVVTALSSQAALADPISCSNSPGSPQLINGKLLTTFTCDITNTGGTASLSLIPFLTQGGATLADNNVGAGYSVIISGDPLTISSNNTNPTALYNTALWQAVLFSPGDQDGGFGSDSITVYWPGFFPSAATVRSVDEGLYSQFGVPDTAFFSQATFPITTVGSFNVNLTPVSSTSPVPEPGTLTLLTSGLLGFAGMTRAKLAQRRQG
jgi:hypothetical protein